MWLLYQDEEDDKQNTDLGESTRKEESRRDTRMAEISITQYANELGTWIGIGRNNEMIKKNCILLPNFTLILNFIRNLSSQFYFQYFINFIIYSYFN